MTTWTTIFADVDGSPVRGDVQEFRRAAGHFEHLGDDAQDALDAFRDFDGRESAGKLEGEAARAFSHFLDDVDGRLATLPRVTGEAAELFRHHEQQLGQLKQRAEDAADSALARARAAWNRRNELESERAELSNASSSLARQIEQLGRSNVDGAADAEIDSLGRRQASVAGSLSAVSGEIGSLTTTLAGIREEWGEIRQAEDRLDEATRDGLDRIDLANLGDPGMFDKIVNFAGGLVMTLGAVALGPIALALMVYDGDWAALLWDLKEILDVVLMVAGVVALFFPLTAPFVIAIFALSAIALAVTTILYVTKEPNPETGETVSGWDVGLSAAGVLLSAGSSFQAFRAARGLPSSFTVQSGLTSLATKHQQMYSVATGADDAAAAAAALDIKILPMPPGTSLTTGLGGVIRSPGGIRALFGLGKDTKGAYDTITGIADMPDALVAADQLTVERSVDVFPQIAYRNRFPEERSWFDQQFLPPDLEPVIIPANP